MRAERADEVWARQCIQAAITDASVVSVDDGSKPGMYDLEIRYQHRSPAAVEVAACRGCGIDRAVAGGQRPWEMDRERAGRGVDCRAVAWGSREDPTCQTPGAPSKP